jgi:hypothetical protein
MNVGRHVSAVVVGMSAAQSAQTEAAVLHHAFQLRGLRKDRRKDCKQKLIPSVFGAGFDAALKQNALSLRQIKAKLKSYTCL